MTGSKLNQSEYFNISQFRLDHWNQLKALADTLHNSSVQGKIDKKTIGQINEVLNQLELLEQYWAFPGLSRLGELKKLFDKEEYAAFSHKVAEVVRATVSRLFFYKDYNIDDDESEQLSDLEISENAQSLFRSPGCRYNDRRRGGRAKKRIC